MIEHRPAAAAGAVVLVFVLSGVVTTRAAGSPAPAPAGLVLHLANGGRVPGALLETDKAATVRWQGAHFASPFAFPLQAVSAVQSQSAGKPTKAEGDFRFVLAGGDVVFGALVALDAKEAVVDLTRFGRVRIRRANLVRIDRWGDRSELIYVGPGDLSSWQQIPAGKADAWHEESGALWTDRLGASLRGDIKLPARAALEFEISWKTKPDFVLALGAGDDDASARRAFRFEVWDDDLVVTRETDEEADVASLMKVASAPGRGHLRAFVDQERGRIVVASADGTTLADLTVADKPPRVLPGLRLDNKGGDVRLERLELTRWGGETLLDTKGKPSGLRRVDGSRPAGDVVAYDALSRSFVVRDGAKETRIPRDEIDHLLFPKPAEAASRAVLVVYDDGTRLGGDLLGVEKDALILKTPGIEGSNRRPLAGVRSIHVCREAGSPATATPSTPRLELDGVRLVGHLVDGQERAGASCLAWQPEGSSTASPLLPGRAGRVINKDTPPPAVPRVTTTTVAPGMVRVLGPRAAMMPQPVAASGLQAFVRGFAGVAGATGAGERPGARSLFLSTGDVIPCEVIRIDENGVTLRSPLIRGTFVPHDKIKALELAPEAGLSVFLNTAKRDRMLMLPRAQKGNPPTHLIRSRNGDYLRGRLVDMDDKTLHVEVRLEPRDIPRDRVSRIIWLHPEAPGTPGAGGAATPAARKAGTLLQAVRGDGTRLTFDCQRVAGRVLSGKSDVLGDCRISLDEADRLLIAGAVNQEVAQLAYQRWKLQDAPEPKVVQDEEGGAGGRPPGTESAMVGKPAPDFELELLDGKKFRVSQAKGRVVVLDFWATWCGPCLQAMPQVEKVATEFRDQGVQLVAVNLQESPTDINAMLERHKLALTVALDRDGAVAQKYNANAIPQTVVIDRAGNVVRLFVGGGPRLGDQLRDAIKDTLTRPEPKEPAK
jgi:thiol-disulfide isomerase/thioredoxin